MNLSDVDRFSPPAGAHAAAQHAAAPDAQALMAQMGGEVAGALSSALERVATLAAHGRISGASLRALRDEIEQARRAAIVGQQVLRLGHGALTHSPERLDLTALLREAVRQRGREIAARGIELRQVFDTAEVRSDATLLFTLLQALLDWSFDHAVGRIDLSLTLQKQWPERAALSVAFAHRPPDQAEIGSSAEPGLDTMSWRLVQQAARALGMPLLRSDSADRTELSFEFAETLAPRLAGLQPESEPDAADSAMASLNAQAVSGGEVLVVATRRELRNVVRAAVKGLALRVQYAATVPDACKLCRETAPQMLVYEAALGGEALDPLLSQLQQQGAAPARVALLEEGRAFDVLNVGGRQLSSVGRAAVIDALPAALQFELSRQG